jgi:hypothetical protein
VRKNSLIILTLLISCILCAGRVAADTHTAATCSLANVQSAYNAAANGDVVAIPAGSCTWSGSLDITKQITLQGAAANGTVITTSGTAVDFGCASGCRISGIHFVGSGSNTAHIIQGYGNNVRIDHNLFTGKASMVIWFADGHTSTGVVDSNTFTIDASSQIVYVKGPDVSTSTAYQAPIDFGSANWVFIEGNTVTSLNSSGVEMFENQNAGKFVARWNTIMEAPGTQMTTLFEQHNTNCWGSREGACDDGITGGKAQIINNNKIYITGTDWHRLLYWRTGTGLFYNNVVDYSAARSDSNVAYAELANYRAYDGCTSGSTPANILSPSLGPTSITRCAKTTYTSGSLRGEGTPTINGVGNGPWKGVAEPVYFWNNRKTADGNTMVDIGGPDVDSTAAWAVASNKQYCVSATAQPSSCGGVALNYSPYTCPHPLTGYTGTCDANTAGTAGYNVVGGQTVPPSPANLRTVE